MAFDQQPADLFGPRRAAGLARRQRGDAGTRQRVDEETQLRRFAGALAAFEGYKAAARQRLVPQSR